MTNRCLTKSDGFYIKVKPHNVHIGNKAMWGLTVHPDRFENINKDPEVLSSTHMKKLVKWDRFS